MWTATSEPTDTHTFQFTVTDACSSETPASVEVSVQSCECLNKASCITDVNFPIGSGEYVCVCPDGFTGQRCEVDIDDCKPNPCRLGHCIDGPNSFSCVCPPGMTGRRSCALVCLNTENRKMNICALVCWYLNLVVIGGRIVLFTTDIRVVLLHFVLYSTVLENHPSVD
ncbi:hypothetical protein XENORESO_017101 [Xenotaenia resolanae]|uniref:EGF-like domain-containing protein n=1 Tax=Xenotaenia resolanae TaxID=208358 RepID=A0ABV0WTB5_9TELE